MLTVAALELPAGRDLDILIAQEILGYRWWYVPALKHNLLLHDPGQELDLAAYLADDQLRGPFAQRVGPAHRDANDPPHFSTDMSDAWRLVEALRRPTEQRLTCLLTVATGTEAYTATAEWWTEHAAAGATVVNLYNTFATAPTAPLAICRAAIIAVGQLPQAAP